jgi:hypothetical protein
MPIDQQWFDELLATDDLVTRDTIQVYGVDIELPVASSGNSYRLRQWQRRVLPDIMPDSVNADAPERTLFRVLYSLTSNQETRTSIEAALSGELAPLEDVFRAETQAKQKKMTLAFHVLAVKAADAKEREAKGYTERTLLLLCRLPNGSINRQLLCDLVEQFRRAPNDLDLAQKILLDALYDSWNPKLGPAFTLPDVANTPELAFDSEAAMLFQEDVRTLIDADLPPADFFRQLNLLLALHLGLYQPRVAALLNPQMDYLFKNADQPDARNLRDIDAWLLQRTERHPFHGALQCRAPDPDLRTVTLYTPARESFERVSGDLALFHFNVLLLVQLRRLGEAWFTHHWSRLADWRAGTLDVETSAKLAARVRGPRDFLFWSGEMSGYALFLERAMMALAVRFIRQQLAHTEHPDALEEARTAPSALHAMRRLYERYNIKNSSNKSSSRAVRQGISITSGLLRQGQYGLVQGRQRVGPFFEVGAGLLPLLLLLAVGSGNEKVPVESFWNRLARYGLSFDTTERRLLLERLRSMGVYERYSDAGEAAYVRNLMTTARAF